MRVAGISSDGAVVTLDATTVAKPASYCRVGDLFVVTKGQDSALGVLTATDNEARLEFTVAADIPLLLNRNTASSPFAHVGAPPAGVISLYRVYWVTYWVRLDGALVRTVYGTTDSTTGIVHQPIAYGIEDLQIEYSMENGDIKDSPGEAAAGADAVMGTSDDVALQVRQVRVTVKFRASRATGETPTRTSKSN
ncbi:MAG: hypothetical protein WKF84_29500 [Pyrinomonadaceae bacterium]